MTARKKIAVILTSHGEAETIGFIENYRVSLHTLSRASEVMVIPVPLQHLISFSSSLKKRMRNGHGTSGSPQNMLARSQSAMLQHHLDRHPASSGIEFDVRTAYSASRPYVEQVLAETMGHDGQIVVPMSPVDNSLSCGLLCGHLAAAYPSGALHRVKVIGRLWTDEALQRAYLDHLFDGGRRLPEKGGRGNALLLLFHGTLVRDKKGGTPSFRTGFEETAAFARNLASRIEADGRNPWDAIMVAYLNHDVGGEWTRPSFEEVCRTLAGSGYGHVSLFAAGYFSDGNETIHRREELAGLDSGLRVESIPCLNDSPFFAGYLAGRVAGGAAQILGFS
jgi:protoporphyrin/coproporphyrin ferrochelatase